MGELSIKIRIAEREYPMRVDAAEEERLRIAGRLINERIKMYRDQFGIDDKQDLLAMVAFDCFAEGLRTDTENQKYINELESKITHLDDLISNSVI